MVKGMVLAAGFGTRMADLTREVPKALLPVAGRPMLAHAIGALRGAGCTEVIVNCHHHAEQIVRHLQGTDYGLPVHLSQESEILGTGGGVLHAASLLAGADVVLLHNADIVSAFALEPLIAQVLGGALAALAVHERETTRGVLFDGDMRFLGKEAWFPVPATGRRLAFCGIHALSPALFAQNFPAVFSDIFDIYRGMLLRGALITGVECAGYWTDLGTPERLRVHEEHLQKNLHPQEYKRAGGWTHA
jgi:NDP-sugar pyrophosphorylase family protein